MISCVIEGKAEGTSGEETSRSWQQGQPVGPLLNIVSLLALKREVPLKTNGECWYLGLPRTASGAHISLGGDVTSVSECGKTALSRVEHS